MPPIPLNWCTKCFYVKCRCEELLKRELLLEAIAKRTGPVTKIGLTPRQRRQALETCEAILESVKRK
jgi:hypothetical protein